MNRKTLTIGVLVGILAAGGTAAYASGEQANLIPPGAPNGYLKINPVTCRFLHHEIDVMPTATERYARAEDSRDDVKLACLADRLGKVGLGAPGPRGKTGPAGPAGPAGANGGLAGYTQVSASGTGASVTATCPAGDVVLGGGSPAEVTGSYPSTASSWTVGRDHLSPKTLVVIATCAEAS